MQEVAEKAKEQKKQDGLLVLACARGYIGDVDQLLDTGADPRAADKRRVSAIHYSCVHGRLEVLHRLQRRGLELDAEDPGGRTPVHWAVLGGHERVLEFLLAKGAWAEGYDSYDDTPLHLAARSGNVALIKLLLASGARSSVSDLNRRALTPLGEAILQGHAEAARMLIDQGKSDVSTRSHDLTLLHIAAMGDKVASLRLLLDRRKLGMEDGGNADGITPLHCAALAGSAACSRLLLDAGADSSITTHDGRLPFDLIPSSAEPEVRKLLQPSKTPHAQDATRKQVFGRAPASGAASASRSRAQAAFMGLSAAQQQSRVQAWADLGEDKRQVAVQGLWPAVLEHVQQLRLARQGLTIQKGSVELLEDEDFQRDSDGGRLDKVIEDVKANPQSYERYAQDPRTMSALAKLKRFHALVKASGQSTVPLDEVLRSRQPNWQADNARRLSGLERMAEAHTCAAIAAALADSEQDAQLKAAEIVNSYKSSAPASTSAPQLDGATSRGKASSVSSDEQQTTAGKGKGQQVAQQAASSGSKRTSEIDGGKTAPAAGKAAAGKDFGSSPATQPNATTPSAKLTQRRKTSSTSTPNGGSTSEIQAADTGDDLAAWEEQQTQEARERHRQLNARWGEVWTWRAFWRELLRQLLKTAAISIAALLAMWGAGFEMPWTSSEAPAAQQPLPVSLEDIYEKPLDLSGPLNLGPHG